LSLLANCHRARRLFTVGGIAVNWENIEKDTLMMNGTSGWMYGGMHGWPIIFLLAMVVVVVFICRTAKK
jgi:hypothetical protein